MKKYSLISFLLSFLLLCNVLVINTVSATGLQVTFTSNPTIATPGTIGYIEVNVRSTSGTSSVGISARSLDTSAVIALGDWDVNAGSIDAGESINVLFKFKVPSTAAPGLYQVHFEVGSSVTQDAIIKVEDSTVVDLVSVSPTSIDIGRATTLTFNVTNNRGTNIENMLFTWEDSNDLILPVGSDNRVIIPLLAAENHTDVPIVVMASSGISPGVYPLTITMEFYDQTGIKQTVVSTVGLQISGTTSFDLVVQSSTSATTSFAVMNTGANVASSVVVSIPQQIGYTTSGVSSSSLGNLDAGDYTLASFSLTSTSSNSTMQLPQFNRTGMGGAPPDSDFTGGRDMFNNRSFPGMGDSRLLVQISYTDVFGVRQTIQKRVNLTTGSLNGFPSRTGTQSSTGNFPSGFPSQTQSSGSNNSLVYIAIGVVGIIIIFGIIQLGRKKKLSRISKLFKGRKE